MIRIYVFFILMCIPFYTCGQITVYSAVKVTFPSLSLLSIEPTNSIMLVFTAPSTAGVSISNPLVNTSKWIKYTSALSEGGNNRKITAKLSELIPGVNINILAANSTSGGGMRGVSSGVVSLSTSDKNIITNIGASFTGTNTNSGHQLTISANVSNYRNLTVLVGKSVNIIYTISDL